MSAMQFLFYIFAGVLTFAALQVVTARNPVHAALFLVLAFFNSACLWLMLEAEFLAIALVLVYIGAVMVLMLFVVMMVDLSLAPNREGLTRYLPAGLVVAGALIFQLVAVIASQTWIGQPVPAPANYENTREIGKLLYTQYIYPFELAGVILLLAIVAAIALTLRPRQGIKTQNPGQQSQVTKAERLRIVKIPAVVPAKE
jgi:NADH-quinone oxidoreductase subunit J